MKTRKRKLRLLGYNLECHTYEDEIRLAFRAMAGNTEYDCTKVLDPYFAAHMIRELRRSC